MRYGGKVRDIMSKKATEFQRVAMSRIYRGKEIFKPLNTGWIDENVACVREWVANIFFYRECETFSVNSIFSMTKYLFLWAGKPHFGFPALAVI